jgi:hypothetical protein
MNRKPTTPEGHAGIFQEYGDIPARYRLETYTQHYDGVDTLQRYYDEVYYPAHEPVSDWMEEQIERVATSWKNHMADRNRHHALATPQDVDLWCQDLLEFCSPKTSYKSYFRRIYNFYNYLQDSHQHPHLYNPLLLAAIEYDATYRVWQYRVKLR